MTTNQTTLDTAPAVETKGEESFAELYGQIDKKREIKEGIILEAMVLSISGGQVNVDAGLKSQSVIPAEEFRDDEGNITIKEDEFVKVKLEYIDDGRGNTHLSHLHYRRDRAWANLVDAFENNKIVEGVINERIKGGYSVQIDGLRAFLPGSLVDLFPIKQEDSLVGKRNRFFVERLKRDRMSAILNRKLVRERELTGGDFSNLSFKKGDSIKGTIAAVVDYPDYKAYVRIDEGVHGVIERDDLAWHRMGNISEVVAIDQEITAIVLDIDDENKKIKLGVKQLQANPWDQIEVTYPVGTKIFAKVTSLKEYGAFCEIEKGIEGLVHVSEMNWLQRSTQPSSFLEVGQEIEVMMLSYEQSSRRISLGLKQCMPNPWEEFSITYRKGSKIKGKISGRQENLGLFVDLQDGLSGLIHVSNLSYSDTLGRDTMASFVDGQEIEVIVIEVDIEKQRIALGIKQLGRNPFEEFRTKYESHEIIKAKVTKLIEPKGARVILNDDVEAFLPIGEICDERIETIASKLKVDDEIEVQIIKFDEKNRIYVSIKSQQKGSANQATRDHRKQVEEETKEKSKSFGSMVRQVLQQSDDEGAESSESEAETPTTDNASDKKPAKADKEAKDS